MFQVRSIYYYGSGDAILESPPLYYSAPTCKMFFKYQVYQGSITVNMVFPNSTTIPLVKKFSTYDTDWHNDTLHIGANDTFKLQIVGSPTYLWWGMTAVDDISFTDCDIGKIIYIIMFYCIAVSMKNEYFEVKRKYRTVD